MTLPVEPGSTSGPVDDPAPAPAAAPTYDTTQYRPTEPYLPAENSTPADQAPYDESAYAAPPPVAVPPAQSAGRRYSGNGIGRRSVVLAPILAPAPAAG